MHFSQRGKLSPYYIGLYEIIEIISPVVYRLVLLEELKRVHNLFHVSCCGSTFLIVCMCLRHLTSS